MFVGEAWSWSGNLAIIGSISGAPFDLGGSIGRVWGVAGGYCVGRWLSESLSLWSEVRWRLSVCGVLMSVGCWSEYTPKLVGCFEVVAVGRRHVEVELSGDWR